MFLILLYKCFKRFIITLQTGETAKFRKNDAATVTGCLYVTPTSVTPQQVAAYKDVKMLSLTLCSELIDNAAC